MLNPPVFVCKLNVTTQGTHVLLVPCAEMTDVQLNVHVTTQALGNKCAPHVEFQDI